MTTLTFSNRNLQGCAIETSIDRSKRASNRLTSICGKYYTVITKEGKQLDFVGRRSFDKWASTNDYMTDF